MSFKDNKLLKRKKVVKVTLLTKNQNMRPLTQTLTMSSSQKTERLRQSASRKSDHSLCSDLSMRQRWANLWWIRTAEAMANCANTATRSSTRRLSLNTRPISCRHKSSTWLSVRWGNPKKQDQSDQKINWTQPKRSSFQTSLSLSELSRFFDKLSM